MSEENKDQQRSYWEVFYDDIFLLFFLGTAIMYIFYTTWGLMELSTVSPSPLLKPAIKANVADAKEATVAAVADNVEKNYWADWPKGRAKGPMPDCNVNVLALGGDDILQATVDLYCGVKPGSYISYINPAVMDVYKAKGGEYPDGKTGVLVFKDINAVFTTDHKDGEPIYNVLKISDESSIASSEAGHPLNPETCATCHATFDGVCKGFVCGNRF